LIVGAIAARRRTSHVDGRWAIEKGWDGRLIVEHPGPIGSRPLRLISGRCRTPTGMLLVDVEVCGVCRTDLHVVEGDLSRAGRRSSRDTRSSDEWRRAAPG